ncbi:MAG: Protein kinase [Verrucomicrobiales bacterium]|nr:Protein kinase [Verrucomicrobiales bacterium]
MSDEDLPYDPFRGVETVTLQELLEDVFDVRIEMDFEGRDPFSGEGALTVNSCIFGDEDRPLHVVARRGNAICLNLLISAGADPNALGDLSFTPLHDAVRRGHLECARILLEAGSRTDAVNEFFGKTPLDYCKPGGWNANPEMFNLLSDGTLNHLRAGLLRGAVRLELECGLEQVPEEIRNLADTLEYLDLSGNRLADLPDWLPELRKLKVFFGSKNPFNHIPEVLGQCPALEMIGFKACQISNLSGKALPAALRWLILTGNQLTDLPEELGRRPRLQKLMLSGNRLSALPDSMAACHNLELLRLAANQFETFPDWLVDLPALAWLAVSGNPCTPFPNAGASSTVPEIPWAELVLGKLLGEGASGHIYEAHWTQSDGEIEVRKVAVKLFKGAMTSDGLPASEMAASLAAAGHRNLLGALGEITAHPDGMTGLVMALVDPAFDTLACPPSLETCTRDIYPSGYPGEVRFTRETAERLLSDLASAAEHLHRRHVLHGDFYSHNVMWHKATGQALLGDFGAASCYPPGDPDKWEQMEVRAFGILMEEVRSLTDGPEDFLSSLQDLADSCQQPEIVQRPHFASVSETLRIIRQAV